MTEKEFKQFFDKNFDGLRSYLYYRSGNLELATDLAQDTFLELWEKQTKNEGKKTIGFAYKIANDLFISRYRKSLVEAKYINSLEFEFTEMSPEKVLEFKELKEKYEHTLAEMDERQRVVFLMSRLEGLKYREIAERLDISVKTVEKRMTGALFTFKEVLKVLYYFLFFSSSVESFEIVGNYIKMHVG